MSSNSNYSINKIETNEKNCWSRYKITRFGANKNKDIDRDIYGL